MESEASIFLRSIWNPEKLGEYEGKWIACNFNNIIHATDDLLELDNYLSHKEYDHSSIIYAYVTFKKYL